MLESTRARFSLGWLTRTIGPLVAAATMCLTLGTNDVSLTPADLPAPARVMQVSTTEDIQRDLECLLRRLMGLECDPDPSDTPPPPIEPPDPPGLI